jgi:hypothetical protein
MWRDGGVEGLAAASVHETRGVRRGSAVAASWGIWGMGKDTTANGYQGLLRYQGLLSISSRAGMVAELKPVWHSALLESGVSCGVMLHFCTWLDATWLDTESVVQQAWR